MPNPCIGCGGPKPKGRGLRYCETCERKPCGDRKSPCHACGSTENKQPKTHYCDDCKELREWRYQTRRRAAKYRNRKACEHCGGNKGPGTGQRLCQSCHEKLYALPRCRVCKREPVRALRKQLCVACKEASDVRKREATAARMRARYAADPKMFIRRAVESAQRRKLDPVYRADQAEKRRLRYRLRQQAKGRYVRHVRPRVAPPEAIKAWLPGRPLALAIDRLAEDADLGVICELAGIIDRLVTAWRRGERNVEMELADKALTRLDLLWWEVWSEETVRVPLFEVNVYAWQMKMARGKRHRTRVRLRCVPYGDQGPDEQKLREIQGLMTGEAVAA